MSIALTRPGCWPLVGIHFLRTFSRVHLYDSSQPTGPVLSAPYFISHVVEAHMHPVGHICLMQQSGCSVTKGREVSLTWFVRRSAHQFLFVCVFDRSYTELLPTRTETTRRKKKLPFWTFTHLPVSFTIFAHSTFCIAITLW